MYIHVCTNQEITKYQLTGTGSTAMITGSAEVMEGNNTAGF
jgi:hypothetical protein